MSDLCQRCKAEPRRPKERYCRGCGLSVRNEAKRKAWQESPNPPKSFSEARGRKCLPPDHSPRYDDAD